MADLLCGLDEAGRGPLAGPVVAGCVILSPNFPLETLNDSKKLSAKKRETAFALISEQCCWGIGIVDNAEIDRINILEASLKAMVLAHTDMKAKLGAFCTRYGLDAANIHLSCIVDGNKCPAIKDEVRAVVKADALEPCVMAASILAKVTRDRIMLRYDALYPQYGYAKHKGYPTKEHRRICQEIGPSPIQRLSFDYKRP